MYRDVTVASPRGACRRVGKSPVEPRSVLELLAPGGGRAIFVRIVREVFPDRAEELLGASAPGVSRERARMRALSRLLSEQYLPLGGLDGYEDIRRGIPIPRLGATDYDYHDVGLLRPGALLLRALIADPYSEMDELYRQELSEEERGEQGDGVRATVLELCEAYVPEELLRDLSRGGGLSPEALRERLDDTQWEAAIWYADYLCRTTGLVFYDTSMEDDEEDPTWSLEELESLAEQWEEGQAREHELEKLFGRLEEDPPTRFRELLDAAFESKAARSRHGRGGRKVCTPGRREPRTLMDVFGAGTGAHGAR